MRLKLLALAAFAAYKYDQHQIDQGKPSMFSGIRDFFNDKKSSDREPPVRPM